MIDFSRYTGYWGDYTAEILSMHKQGATTGEIAECISKKANTNRITKQMVEYILCRIGALYPEPDKPTSWPHRISYPKRSVAERMALTIDQLELSARTTNVFRREGISTVSDIVKLRSCDLLRIPNFGTISLREIKEVLESLGFHLADDLRSPVSVTNQDHSQGVTLSVSCNDACVRLTIQWSGLSSPIIVGFSPTNAFRLASELHVAALACARQEAPTVQGRRVADMREGTDAV